MKIAPVLWMLILLAGCEGVSNDEAHRVQDVLGISNGVRVADIGAGQGDLTAHLAGAVGASGRVYATEIDATLLEQLAARFAALPQVSVLPAGTHTSGLPDACCEALVMRNVYHHLSDPEPILASLHAALVPGGRLLIIDFGPSWLLAPWTPDDLPADRTGHGIEPEIIVREAQARGFELDRLLPDWAQGGHGAFAVLLRRP
ncbi:MAG: methyltransferase domain-containing protein [Pseudomonadales bacterium]|nr:methyltransferase domain-containing protein [Pseudomonadales bacterium]